MVTYKHEKYIRQAIEGVLMQQCDFEVELVIADDCSPDGTEQVVQSFSAHPRFGWIRYTRHQQNKGSITNFQWALSQCKGEYTAICDGDDYWIDPHKLQKQVDFLDRSAGYVMHSTNALKSNLINQKESSFNYPTESFGIENLLASNPLLTCTLLFRNEYTLSFSQFNTSLISGDWWLILTLLYQSNKLAFRSEDTTAVYRIHEGGVMQTISDQKGIQHHINFINATKGVFTFRLTTLQHQKLSALYLDLFRVFIRKRDLLSATGIVIKDLMNNTFHTDLAKYPVFIRSKMKRSK